MYQVILPMLQRPMGQILLEAAQKELFPERTLANLPFKLAAPYPTSLLCHLVVSVVNEQTERTLAVFREWALDVCCQVGMDN